MRNELDRTFVVDGKAYELVPAFAAGIDTTRPDVVFLEEGGAYIIREKPTQVVHIDGGMPV